ncbi:MAG TPA: UPF0182 family protein [Actinomycetota bacterium]|nr:UPF0182 family protein [Actinomycetota bacterium]
MRPGRVMDAEFRPRRRRGLIIVAIVVLLIVLASTSRFYTDLLWFQELGLTSVLWTSLATQFGVGIAVGLLTGAFVWLNLWLTARLAPAYRTVRTGPANDLDRYRDALTPFLRWIRLAVAAFIALTAGGSAGTAWRTFLLWSNRVPFGETDPQFGKDIGFYVFELPFLEQLTDWVWFAIAAALFFSVIGHFFHGSIQPVFGLRGITSGALAHLSVLLGLLALAKSAQYWLGQYSLNFSPRGVVTGASYTDVHAQLPALKLLAIISIISAVLFLVNIRFRSILLPMGAVGIWILTAFLAGGVWPWAVQRFSVDPQELIRERPFIARNIEATRAAFGLDEVEEQEFPATTDLGADDIRASEPLLQNVRLWDPGVLQLAYQQLQALRPYYNFEDVDIDRYEIDGTTRQVLLSARELSLDDLPENSRTWSNEHLQFTHGFGLVASLANSRTSAGQPSFLVKDVPGTVVSGAESLDAEQPRLYFGETFEPEEYAVVNSRQAELDFETQTEVQRSSYEGKGGIPVGGLFRRIMFAIREGDPNLVLSSLITDESRILIYRDVRDRVRRAAPFLALDHDPYPAVVGGRVVWILDAYTSTRHYPYSERFDADEVLAHPEEGVLGGTVSYVRNSVKVVVDALDGTMDLYIVDPEDPLIQTWERAFPDLFRAGEPSDELREHFRYPEDLFELQSEVFLTYHMEDPDDFYSKTDTWDIPINPISQEGAFFQRSPTVVPTYLLVQLPGETESDFVLTRPFTPRARNNMIAFMVARSDPEDYGELLTLEFPRSIQVPGPIQVDNAINQDVEISQTLTLLRSGGSRVDFGSLVILPIEDSILYVQPLFVTAETVGIPELKRVVLALGEEVAMEETFEEALATLFDLDAEPVPDPTEPTPPDAEPGPPTDLNALIERAAELYERAQAALSDGDFESYGRLIERLGRVLAEAQRLSGR